MAKRVKSFLHFFLSLFFKAYLKKGFFCLFLLLLASVLLGWKAGWFIKTRFSFLEHSRFIWLTFFLHLFFSVPEAVPFYLSPTQSLDRSFFSLCSDLFCFWTVIFFFYSDFHSFTFHFFFIFLFACDLFQFAFSPIFLSCSRFKI